MTKGERPADEAAGLSLLTVYREQSNEQQYARLRSFWVTVFAIGSVMGTVTGTSMSIQFGTNLPQLSEMAGELIGGPLAFEAKIALFIEAVCLGVGC